MPSQELSDRPQIAVLWPSEGYDSYGRNTIGEPVEIRVRWVTEDTDVTSNLADPGASSRRTLVSVLATVIVDRVIPLGSTLWLGTLAEWYGIGSAGENSKVMEVSDYQEIPDIKGRSYLRFIRVKRLKDTLPNSR